MERSHIALNKWLMAFYLMSRQQEGRQRPPAPPRAWPRLQVGLVHVPSHPRSDARRRPGPARRRRQDRRSRRNLFRPARSQAHRSVKGRPFTKNRKGREQARHRGAGRARRQRPLVPRSAADKATVEQDREREHRPRKPRLHTDESKLYFGADAHFAAHETVKHRQERHEYVRGDVHTNSAKAISQSSSAACSGVYQHCGEKHLHRYLAEFDFRYNHRVALGVSDIDRTKAAIKGIEGKRLMYRQPTGNPVGAELDSESQLRSASKIGANIDAMGRGARHWRIQLPSHLVLVGCSLLETVATG